MCNTPKLQRGNDYKIKCPYNLQNADGTVTPIAVATMTDVEVKVLRGSVPVKESVTYTSADNYFLVDIPATYASGEYAIIISGKIAGRSVRDARKYAFTLVEWGEHSDASDYVQGTEITLEDGVFIFAADTDGVAELEEQLREKIAEVEEEKAEWQRKIAELEGVAKETKATENKNEILRKIETTQPDLSAIAKEAQATANKQEILQKIEGIGQYLPQDIATQSMLNALKAAIQGTDNTATLTAIQEAIDNIQIDLSPVISNQQKMMVNFGMADEMPELVALTDTEILNQYDGYDSEGTHIEGIADTTYGHLVPAQVTIDDEPFTFYVERTYADYGYSTLYDSEGEPYAVTNHPKEGDELYTTND